MTLVGHAPPTIGLEQSSVLQPDTAASAEAFVVSGDGVALRSDVIVAFQDAVRELAALKRDRKRVARKLRARVVAAVAEATGEDAETCAAAVREADGDGRIALLSLLASVPAGTARNALAVTRGHLGDALRSLTQRAASPFE